MQKLDYLEDKINEILSEISYLSERIDNLESKLMKNLDTKDDSK